MTPDNIKTALIEELQIIAPEIDPASVDPDDDLREGYEIDSIDFLTFISAINQRLGIDVPEADYPHMTSIDQATAYLDARLKDAA
jgi:acyl carrier protein